MRDYDVTGVQTCALPISVFSATYPQANPWQHPWLFRLMTHWGWIDYSEKIADFKKPLMTWFPALPDAEKGGKNYWIEFTVLEADGTRSQLTLRDGGSVQREGARTEGKTRQLQRILIATENAWRNDTPNICEVETDAFVAGTLFSGPSGMVKYITPQFAFLHGLPTLRKSGYRRGKVRYLKTQLRRDAFRCRHAAGQVTYTPPGETRPLLFRTDLWLCPEVPFGVLKMESTIYDKTTGTLLGRRQLIATAVGKLLPTDTDGKDTDE